MNLSVEQYIQKTLPHHLDRHLLLPVTAVILRKADPDTLVDISRIEIDMKKPVPARVDEYVRKVGNPFLVRVGDYVVKIGYSGNSGTLNDRMKQYIRKVAEIKY